jgi:microsomal dipeptidase-like Zn-dependent dipeptidase
VCGLASDTLAGHRKAAEAGALKLIALTGTSDAPVLTDMDGIGPAAVFTSYTRWPSLAAALLEHGYRQEDAAKILGGNALRVFRAVLPSV